MNISDLLLELVNRVQALESIVAQSQTQIFQPSSSDQVLSSSQRIPVSGEDYYLDFDGSAVLKNLILKLNGSTILDVNGNDLTINPDIIPDDNNVEDFLCLKSDGSVCKKQGAESIGTTKRLTTHWQAVEVGNKLQLQYSSTGESPWTIRASF